jgi:hypothetical protein
MRSSPPWPLIENCLNLLLRLGAAHFTIVASPGMARQPGPAWIGTSSSTMKLVPNSVTRMSLSALVDSYCMPSVGFENARATSGDCAWAGTATASAASGPARSPTAPRPLS